MLTVAGRLLLLVEAAPRCKCGGNCETLQFLAKTLTERKVREDGWQLRTELVISKLWLHRLKEIPRDDIAKKVEGFSAEGLATPASFHMKVTDTNGSSATRPAPSPRRGELPLLTSK